MIKVVLLGAGNVAFHLANKLLKSTACTLVQVYNRNKDKIAYLNQKTAITNQISDLKEADVYIICVSDNAISELSKQLNFKEKLVVHTSGAMDLTSLKTAANKGVFYPLQSFSTTTKINFAEVPFCLETEHYTDFELLQKIATSFGSPSYSINSAQRKQLHVAAVFVNNFVNHLYQIGNEICSTHQIPFKLLAPIIKETASKIENLAPFDAQTGPAKRNDTNTLKKHEAMLTKNQKEIYTLLTKSIYNTYGKKL